MVQEDPGTIPAAEAAPRLLSGAAPETATYLVGLLRLLDVAVALTASALAYELRHWMAAMPPDYWLATCLAAFLALQFLQSSGAYDFDGLCRRSAQVGRCVRACLATAVTLATLSFLLKSADDFSRIWAVAWFAGATLGFSLNRAAISTAICRWNRDGRFHRRVAVVGVGTMPSQAAARLRESEGVRVVRVFMGAEASTLDELVAFVRAGRADEVLVAIPFELESELGETLRRLGEAPVDVKLCPGVPRLPPLAFPRGRRSSLLAWPVLERPLKGWSRVVKRGEDIGLSFALLLALAPLILVLAGLIKLDSRGPVFFRQPRHGFNNQPFTILKFRTMRHEPGRPDVPQAQRSDPRVTRLGGFLRRSSLDELPQLFNVLAGQMSLVGPRPHAISHGEQYAALVDQYFARHRVKPGITGWAQVNGLRGGTDDLEKIRLRVQHDLHYVENWSLLFDFKILAVTVWAVLSAKNAF